MTFVVQAKGELVKREYLNDFNGIPNVRVCFPSMEGLIYCMHSKLMLLSHPTYLRVVVPTANLVPYDWGYTGTMENSVFLIDLPRLPEGQTTSSENMTFFGQELIYFIKAMGLDSNTIESIHKFDFSATKDFAFVHTIGGAHRSQIEVADPNDASVEPWQRTGYCGLSRSVNMLGLESRKEVKVDYITSSVGCVEPRSWANSASQSQALTLQTLTSTVSRSLNNDFLGTLSSAACGSPSTMDRPTAANATLIAQIRSNFRIYFPTHDTIAASAGGPNHAGTICFQAKWYNAPTFPRELLRDCVSERKGYVLLETSHSSFLGP